MTRSSFKTIVNNISLAKEGKRDEGKWRKAEAKNSWTRAPTNQFKKKFLSQHQQWGGRENKNKIKNTYKSDTNLIIFFITCQLKEENEEEAEEEGEGGNKKRKKEEKEEEK